MKKLIENLMIVGAASVFLATGLLAQPTGRLAPDIDGAGAPSPPSPMRPSMFPRSGVFTRDTTERSIKVDPAINLEFSCVVEGNIRVNGWRRNEVRVFVAGGSKFAFRTAQENIKGDAPVWVKVVGINSDRRIGPDSECLSGGSIEVDVPVGASIRIRGREISTAVDTVKKVDITSIGGDISLRNISAGISANAGRGDITVEAGKGSMMLTTTEGNIVVFEGSPSDYGDIFKANTHSGTISLQSLEYRQVNVGSISGSVSYSGPILSGGSYNLRTSKGSIRMSVPAKSGFRFWATYGYGSFACDLPHEIITENFVGPLKALAGKAGSGEATLKVTADNGSIAIRKQ